MFLASTVAQNKHSALLMKFVGKYLWFVSVHMHNKGNMFVIRVTQYRDHGVLPGDEASQVTLQEVLHLRRPNCM